jgi:hypothetical protein
MAAVNPRRIFFSNISADTFVISFEVTVLYNWRFGSTIRQYFFGTIICHGLDNFIFLFLDFLDLSFFKFSLHITDQIPVSATKDGTHNFNWILDIFHPLTSEIYSTW